MLDELVQALLSATDASARASAAEALARRGDEARAAAVALVRASGDRDASVRDWAAAALEELGPPLAADIEPLAVLATNPELNIAYWACTLLGRLKDQGASAVPDLTDALSQHQHLVVRERAAWSLGQIGPAAKSALPELQQAAQSGEPRLTRLAQAAISSLRG
jgi:HEAT repeat protein